MSARQRDERSTRLASWSMAAALAFAVSVNAVGPAMAKKRPAERIGTIAFVSDRTGEDEIHLLHLKSMKSTRLTRNPQVPDRAPAWSPNGKWLAFNSRRKPDFSQPDIYVIHVGTDAVRRVTETTTEEQRASWTRDGDSLVYQRGDFSLGFELWRTNLENGKERRLTSRASSSFDVAPDPSPISNDIVLQTNRGSSGIFPFKLALRRPGDKTPSVVELALTESIDGPRWAPDGKRIAFAADGELYVLNIETMRLRRLTEDRHQDLSPDWSPDGKSLVFQSDRRVKTGGLHMLHLASGKVTFLREGRTPVWTAREH